jgi:hypothetical protein
MHESRAELYGVKVHLDKDDPEYDRDRDDPAQPYYYPHHSIIVEIVGGDEIHVTHDFPGYVTIEVHDYDLEEKTGAPTPFEPGVGRKAVRQAREVYDDFVQECEENARSYQDELRERRL